MKNIGAFLHKKRIPIIVSFLILSILIISVVSGLRVHDARRLRDAIEANDTNLLKEILEDGAYVDGYTLPLIALPVCIITDTALPVTPLQIACRDGNTEAVKILLEYGADANKTYPGAFSCIGMIYATPEGRNSRFEIIPLLIESGAVPNGTGHGKRYNHAAFLEARFATDETAEKSCALIECVTDDAAQLKNGYRATLLGAVDSTEVAHWLIERGADLNASDRYGFTPLMRAVTGGNFDMVELLVSFGADLYVRNKDGQTAYDLAVERGYAEIAELLK